MRAIIPSLIFAATTGLAACGDSDSPATDTSTATDVETDTLETPDTENVEDTEVPDGSISDALDEVQVNDVESDVTLTCDLVPILGRQHNDNTEACISCMHTNCCEEMAGCEADSVCMAARTCFATCSSSDDVACIDACSDANPGLETANGPMISCRNTECAYECALDVCVGEVVYDTPPAESWTIANTFIDFQSREPVSGLTVKVCAKTDLECEAPLEEGTTDENGAVTLTIPSAPEGFSAFLTASKEAYLPTDFWYVSTDPAGRLALGALSWSVVSESTANLLTTFVSAPLDPERGSISFAATDCARLGLAGITVTADTADEGTTTMYMTGAIPSVEVTTTQAGGTGGLLNLPAGLTTLTGTGKDGRIWGSHQVNVRKGHMIGTNIVATPVAEEPVPAE